MSNIRALIFANGRLPDVHKVRSLVQPGDVLIAADGGTHHILSIGLTPSVIVGDLDSLSAGSLENIGIKPACDHSPPPR